MERVEAEIISHNQTHAIRHEVLWPHKKRVQDCVIDVDDLSDTFHIGGLINGEIVGVSTFFPQAHERVTAVNPYRLRAMGALSQVRKKGVGRSMIQEAERELKARGCDVLWCDAREVARDFYERLGFEVVYGPYNIPIIGVHYLMAKRL